MCRASPRCSASCSTPWCRASRPAARSSTRCARSRAPKAPSRSPRSSQRTGLRLVEEHRTWPPDADAFYLARLERSRLIGGILVAWLDAISAGRSWTTAIGSSAGSSQGAMGVVYRGVRTTLDREVAIKVMHVALPEAMKVRERFEREAQADGAARSSALRLDHRLRPARPEAVRRDGARARPEPARDARRAEAAWRSRARST